MQRILSTYLFVSKKLTPELLAQIHHAGFQAVEIFAARSHFDYATNVEVRTMAQALADNRLRLNSLHARHAGVTICVENTNTEMGEPSYLRSFIDETRLTGLRINFDVGHAHLGDGPKAERIEKSFEPLSELIAGAHIHDNHGEKDEHLPPFDGSIDWAVALKLLRSTAVGDLPLTLEVKEKTGPDAPSVADQITAAAKSLDRLEETSHQPT